MMTNTTFYVLIIVAGVVMLVGLTWSEYFNARLKLPGVRFSLRARNKRRLR
jgi:cytochrome b subunit of formate dehydrogenase